MEGDLSTSLHPLVAEMRRRREIMGPKYEYYKAVLGNVDR